MELLQEGDHTAEITEEQTRHLKYKTQHIIGTNTQKGRNIRKTTGDVNFSTFSFFRLY